MASKKRLIDSNALKNKAKYQGHCVSPLVTGYHLCVSVSDIDNAPTVDAVEVVHGRWVELGSDDTDDLRWMCSNCNEVWFYSPVRNNYCPNCGAKMDGGNENG